MPFSINELLDALSDSSNSAVGLDNIYYQMLKHLPLEAFYTLINPLNDTRITGNFFPLGTTHMMFQYQNLAKIQQTHPVTAPLLLQAVFVNYWSV